MQLHSFEKCTNQEQGVSNPHDRLEEGSAFITAETIHTIYANQTI